MPITQEFKYYKPATVKEAVKLLSEHKGRARPLAGGTDLVVKLKDGLDNPAVLIDIKGIKELKRLELEKKEILIGAAVTFTELIESEDIKKNFPVLWEASRTVASVGVRNRATLAGNICSAVPSLDSAPALLVYGAEVFVEGARGRREIPLEKWFTGPKQTALGKDELVVGLSLKRPQKHGGAYVKLGRYCGEDLAQAGVAVIASPGNEYKIAFCALGPVPKRAKKIEKLLNGKKLADALIKEARAIVPAEISPITDIRATKEYRSHMAAVMLERALKTAAARLAGKAPRYGENLI